MNFPIEIVNEDGTPITNTPRNGLYEKYPECKSEGYKCMYCGDCPSGDNFDVTKLPEEDQVVFKKWLEDCREYNKIHNPTIYRKLYEE